MPTIDTDFDLQEHDDTTKHRAAVAICYHATDRDDAYLMLRMLGLLSEPAPAAPPALPVPSGIAVCVRCGSPMTQCKAVPDGWRRQGALGMCNPCYRKQRKEQSR